MQLAKIDAGIVTRIIAASMPHSEVNAAGVITATEVKPTDPALFFGAGAVVVEAPDTVREGWLYDGINFNPPPIDPMAAANTARMIRDQAIASTDWLVNRHKDQVDQGHPTTLTADQYKALMAYRQDLRDLPSSQGFPINITWPNRPV